MAPGYRRWVAAVCAPGWAAPRGDRRLDGPGRQAGDVGAFVVHPGASEPILI